MITYSKVKSLDAALASIVKMLQVQELIMRPPVPMVRNLISVESRQEMNDDNENNKI